MLSLRTCVHLATDRYRSAGPSFASSYSPKSVTPVQSDTLSSFRAQYDGIHLTPASVKQVFISSVLKNDNNVKLTDYCSK